MKVRLQKFLADAGVASRRASEEIILAGRAAINGVPARELGVKVDPDEDRVTLDGVPVKSKRKMYLALNKPSGCIASRKDPLKRPTVNEILPKEYQNLYTVGRLDYHTEGLIFLTNDGQFALRITHPRYGVAKKYLATVPGKVDQDQLRQMVRGVSHEGERLKADEARLLKTSGTNSLVELVLTEGKNREVRRLFETLGLEIERLKRVQIGPIKLGELPKGRWRKLTEPEINSLLAKTRAARKRREKGDQ